jgi:hypothetical protein
LGKRYLGAYRVVRYLMVVPNGDPRELLVASNEVQVGAVCREPPTVVVESVDLVVGLRDTTDAVAPTVISVLVFVDVVAKMNNVIHGVLSKSSAGEAQHNR